MEASSKTIRGTILRMRASGICAGDSGHGGSLQQIGNQALGRGRVLPILWKALH